ncbi:MAG: hypothetical protein ACI84K_000843 [Pseudohongiellaceae bacterium]|jgi:hypothetical protein
MIEVNPKSASFVGRLNAFMTIIYEPKLHLAFAALWFLSLQGHIILQAGDGKPWVFSLASLIGVVTMFLVMFYLRAVDEVKDLDYDKKYNPERPLVMGAVTMTDIRRYWLLAFLVIPVINIGLGPWLALFIIADMFYGLLLLKLEQWISLMGRSMVFNLLLTYPVSIALSVYTLLLTDWVLGVKVQSISLLIIGIYILAFLNFEIVRKNLWPSMAEEGERFYSHDLGPMKAATLALACAVTAITLIICLNAPWKAIGGASITGWLPLLALYPAIKSFITFNKERTTRYNPRKLAVMFIAIFYLTNLIHALTANQLALALLG